MTASRARRHTPKHVFEAATLFFAVRGLVRTRLARGRKFGPSAWLRIETLKFISDHEEPTMKDIADYLSITAPSASSLISGLMKEGFVVRRVDTKDRRASRLRLSARGKRLLTQTLTRGVKVFAELFAPLTPAELSAFTRALASVKGSAQK